MSFLILLSVLGATPAFAASDVCDRSPPIRWTIEYLLGKDCHQITTADLARLHDLQVQGVVDNLTTSDLEGLTGLTRLTLSLSSLDRGVLSDRLLAGVEWLELDFQGFTPGPDAFSKLHWMKYLVLYVDFEETSSSFLPYVPSTIGLWVDGKGLSELDGLALRRAWDRSESLTLESDEELPEPLIQALDYIPASAQNAPPPRLVLRLKGRAAECSEDTFEKLMCRGALNEMSCFKPYFRSTHAFAPH